MREPGREDRSGLGMGYSTARRGVEGFTDKGNRERGVTGHSGWEREKNRR